MTRTIPIDTDTSISYIFPEKVFQINNKSTSTTRTTAENAKNVLDIVAPDNEISPQDLIDQLVTPMETINKLSYTWNSTGAYIQTIQFNDYSKYPLTLDLDKNKLYIMNSNIIYDLTLNESPTPRIQYIQAFYSNTLGLLITFNDLEKIYDLLYSFYLPTVYNNIAPRQTDSTGNRLPLSYTNTIQLSNNSNTSKATYTLTMNPNDTYTHTQLARILQLQTNVITLASTVPSEIQVGQTLTLYNTNTTVNGTTYTADGDYIVESIKDNTITVNKEFPTPYLYEPPTLNAVAYKSLIEEVSRENNTITLVDRVSNSYVVGDKIELRGTKFVTDLETLTADGTYTIQSISDNKITVEEAPPITCTNTVTTVEDVDKRIAMSSSNGSDTITMREGEDLTPYATENTELHFITTTRGEATDDIYTVRSISNNVISVNEDIQESYSPVNLNVFANPLEIYTIKPASNDRYRIITTLSYLGKYLMDYQVGDKIRLFNIPDYTSTATDTTFKSDERVYTIRSIRPSAALAEGTSATLAIQVEEDTMQTNATFTNTINTATNPYIMKAVPISPLVNSVIDDQLSLSTSAFTLPEKTDTVEIYSLLAPVNGERKVIRTIPRLPIYAFPYQVGEQVTIKFPSSYVAGDGTYTIESIERVDTYYNITFVEPIPITGTNALNWNNSSNAGNPYMYMASQTSLHVGDWIDLTQNTESYADAQVTEVEPDHTFTLNTTIPKYLAPYIYKKKITTTESGAYIYRRIEMGNVDNITNKVVTLSDTPLITLTNSDPVVVIYQDKHEEYSNVNTIDNNIVTVYHTLTNFTNNSGILQKRTPSPEILIQVTNSKDETLMPNTAFMVDNSTQATAYLSLLNTLTVPTEACYNNSTMKVEETYEINTSTVQYMNLLGLYNEIYSESM